jgi:hypothetical protein
MANPLVLLNRYTPKVGQGGPMLEALRFQNNVWNEQGLPGFELWKPYDGPHNSVVTVQRWASFSDWEAMRATLPTIPQCRDAVFDRLYPTNESPYYTTYYEVLH